MSGSKQATHPSMDYSSGKYGSQNSPWSRPRLSRTHRSPGIGDTRPECRATVDSGVMCGETRTLRITDELKKLYENRLRKLDEDIGEDAAGDSGQLQIKVNVLQSWVQDLLEQNAELVHTVEELEREIGHRVKLLEEKLMESARACREYMTKIHDFESEMRDAAADKEKEERLQSRLGNLTSDVSNLLKLICRAREHGVWSADDLIFYEVTKEDIFRSSPLAAKEATVSPVPRDGPFAQSDPMSLRAAADARSAPVVRSAAFPQSVQMFPQAAAVVRSGPFPQSVQMFPQAAADVQSAPLTQAAVPVESESVVVPVVLPPKTPRKVKLSLELALNRVNRNPSSTSYDDATKPSPVTYQWTFEPPNEPCTCNPNNDYPRP